MELLAVPLSLMTDLVSDKTEIIIGEWKMHPCLKSALSEVSVPHDFGIKQHCAENFYYRCNYVYANYNNTSTYKFNTVIIAIIVASNFNKKQPEGHL